MIVGGGEGGGRYMLKTMRVLEDSLRVIDDDSNDVKSGAGFGIIDAGSLKINTVQPSSVLCEFRFLLLRG